ncbi:MAG: L,D-transpeptidase [bacterium]
MNARHVIPALLLSLTLGTAGACSADPATGTRRSVRSRDDAGTAGNAGASEGRPASKPALGTPVHWDGKAALPRLPRGKIWAFEDGRRRALPLSEARRLGFTVVELGDSWTPVLFTEQSPLDKQPIPFPYRKRYLDLANDRTDRQGRKLPRDRSNHLELYGVPPTPSVIRKRLRDRLVRSCMAKVDLKALKAFRGSVSAWGFGFALRRARSTRETVNRVLRRKRLAQESQLSQTRAGRRILQKLQRAEGRGKAVAAAIQVLRCERLLPEQRRRRLRRTPPGDELYTALTAFERKHMIVGQGTLTRDVTLAMARTPDEADADALRRVIRERVVHAAQIIEDGSALRLKPTYLDRRGRERKRTNLVKRFTQAALNNLGLTTPSAVRGFLLAMPAPDLRDLRVALRLPGRPDYYSADMDLEVVIQRGDVFYDPPVDDQGKKVAQYRGRTPRLTLWLNDRGQRIPLVRWRTTVGGWNDEIKDGHVYLKYKPSNVGKRVWRDVVAAPIWIPPPSTPPKEIVRGKKLKKDAMGPGHLSAYGLVAAPHLLPVKRRGELHYWDQGIRTHGSYNYRSIRAGYSHGCHRLYNHKAIRLFSFLLHHRPHVRVGLEPYPYQHRFEYKGHKFKIKVENRGYVYRFVKPLSVQVTRGRVLGTKKRPIKDYLPKPGVDYPTDAGVPAASTDGGVPTPTSSSDGGAPAPKNTPDGGVPTTSGSSAPRRELR